MTAPVIVMLYDGHCALCRATVAFIKERDHAGQIECADLQLPENEARFPSFSKEAVREQIHVLDQDKRVFIGAAGTRQFLALLPGWGWLAWMLGVPGLRWIAQFIYMRIANNRYRFNPWLERREQCADDTCAVDRAQQETSPDS